MGSNPAIPTNALEFKDVVKRRKMVRNYLDEPVARDAVKRIVRAARRAPSAGFSQGQSFVVVTDPQVRESIAGLLNEAGYRRKGLPPWFSKAPVHVVCCVNEAAYRSRYAQPDKKTGAPDEWPVPYPFIDGGASLMVLLLAAVDEGLSAGFHGFKKDHWPKLRALVGIPEGITPIGLVTIGRAAGEQRAGSRSRGRRPEREVIHWERWSPQPGGASPRPPHLRQPT